MRWYLCFLHTGLSNIFDIHNKFGFYHFLNYIYFSEYQLHFLFFKYKNFNRYESNINLYLLIIIEKTQNLSLGKKVQLTSQEISKKKNKIREMHQNKISN